MHEKKEKFQNRFQVSNPFPGVPLHHHLNELVEVDGTVSIGVHVPDHILEFLLRRMETMGLHHLNIQDLGYQVQQGVGRSGEISHEMRLFSFPCQILAFGLLAISHNYSLFHVTTI